MKRTLRIDFVDFWPNFKKTDNFFYNILKKYYKLKITSKPDFLFCSCFSQKHFRYKNCVKILYMGENIVPDFNLYDYAMGFHYISFEDRYLMLPHYVLYEEDVKLALHKHEHEDAYFLNKRKFCNRVVSNPEAAPEREELCRLLESVARVDSGGRYANNVGGPVKDKIAFERAYRFTLAFENSSTPGYTTEKILQAFAGETIPIYWGDPCIAEQFNPEAFINAMDYPDPKELIRKVKSVWEDDAQYLAMMKAPAVKPGSLAEKYLAPNYVDEFLRCIVEQEPKAAFRRNMVYAGEKYQRDAYASARSKAVRDLVQRPIHLIQLRRKQRG